MKLEHEVCGWTWAYPPVHRFKLTEMVAATTMHVMFECTGARPC